MTPPADPDTRQPTIDDAFFWAAAAEGRLVIQRCGQCKTLRHPPAPMCGTCGSLEWDAAEASGRGRIVSWISSVHPNRPDDEPRIVILVQLDEGTRLVSNLVDPVHAGPYEDLPVVAVFRDDRGTPTPFFQIATEGARS